MRATEIIRGILDLIDQVECAQIQQQIEQEPSMGTFAQIFAQMTAEPVNVEKPSASIYDNSPDPHVKDIDSVTTAAGLGTLGASSPADIRTTTFSMYPNHQAKG